METFVNRVGCMVGCFPPPPTLLLPSRSAHDHDGHLVYGKEKFMQFSSESPWPFLLPSLILEQRGYCSSNSFYQSTLILTKLFQHNLINVSYLTACYLYQVMMTLHFLNDVANDAESTQK